MIYFVQAPTGGPIKIGKAVDVERRHAQLQWRYDAELVVLGTRDGYGEEEAEIHEQFAHLRIRRTEQFRATRELVEFIGAGIVDDGDEKELKVGGEQEVRSVRLDLSPESHRLLRILAAHEGISMTKWVETRVTKHLDEQAEIYGWRKPAALATES